MLRGAGEEGSKAREGGEIVHRSEESTGGYIRREDLRGTAEGRTANCLLEGSQRSGETGSRDGRENGGRIVVEGGTARNKETKLRDRGNQFEVPRTCMF